MQTRDNFDRALRSLLVRAGTVTTSIFSNSGSNQAKRRPSEKTHIYFVDFIFLCYIRFKDWFVASVEGMKKELIRTSKPDDLLYIGELLRGKNFSPKMVRKNEWEWE